jgi:transposase-like protein
MISVHIREANSTDVSLVSGLIRKSFLGVARRFGLTLENCSKHPSIHPIMLYRWRKEYREGKFKKDKRKKKIQLDTKKVAELLRIQELEREVKKLRIENDLLKKTIEFNSEKRRRFSRS